MAQAVSRRHLTVEAKVEHGSVHVEFLVDKVAPRQVCLQVVRYPPVHIILPSTPQSSQ
jgi:hypothetical protein